MFNPLLRVLSFHVGRIDEWPESPILSSRIRFKPPAIAELAREVGIDAEVLDELKRQGITDLEQLRIRLKLEKAEAGSTEEDQDHSAHDDYRGEDEEDDRQPEAGDGEGSDMPPTEDD